MVRIEIHLDKTETDILDAIAKEDGRSRKNLCETQIRNGGVKSLFLVFISYLSFVIIECFGFVIPHFAKP